MERKSQGVQMGFKPCFKSGNGGGLVYVWWQLVPQARSSYCKGPITLSGAGDMEKTHIRGS